MENINSNNEQNMDLNNSGNSDNSTNSGSDNVWMPLSNDWNMERLTNLKNLFPDLFTNEGKLNIEELKKVIDPQSVTETERYEFRWFGKSEAKRNAYTPSNATLIFDEQRSVNPTESENIIIEGENLEVLKLLSDSYREQVKCIYIDPPYNVDADAIYLDDYSEDKKPYWEKTGITEDGVIIDTNFEANGRFHSNWLNMMYSRLLIARTLLNNEGMVFIQIDDKEFSNLRKVADEVFGEENFITSICVKMSHLSGMKMSHREKKLPKIKEFVLLYAKSKEDFSLNTVYIPGKWDDVLDRYDYFVDSDDTIPCEQWKIEHINEVLKKNKLETVEAIDNFKIANAHKIFRTAVNDSFAELPKNNYFERITSKTGLNKIIYKGEEVLFASTKISKIDGKNVPAESIGDIWLDIGINNLHNEGGVPFPNGKKPYKLIKRILQLATNDGDLILDFFSGSGTTGEATLDLNKDENTKRKYILIQIPEMSGSESEPYKAGFKKISDITIFRNKRVVEKLIEEKKKEQPNLFTNGHAEDALKGLGFKVFKLVKSNFPRVEWAPEVDKTEAENIELLKQYIRDKEAQLITAFNRDELLTEILLKHGFTLNYKTEKQNQFQKNEILLVTDPAKSGTRSIKETLICLDVAIDAETVEHFKKHTDKKFICLQRALDTTKKYNLRHYLGDKFHAF